MISFPLILATCGKPRIILHFWWLFYLLAHGIATKVVLTSSWDYYTPTWFTDSSENSVLGLKV